MTTAKPPALTTADVKSLELLSFRIGTRQPTLLKVSTVYENYITATVLLDEGELTGRTKVRQYAAADVAKMKRASAQLINKYDDMAGFSRA